MKKCLLIFIVLLYSFSSTLAQRENRWQKQRYELIFGAGTSHFFGDLGGGTNEVSHFFAYNDLDMALTQPAFQLGWRVKLLERVALKFHGSYGAVQGDDNQADPASSRYLRGLSFKSDIYEFGSQLELSLIKEFRGKRYITNNPLFTNVNVYVFGGVGGFYFNPKAQLDGVWYELQPLGTEGQGIGNNPPKYDRFQVCYPVGGGIKFWVSPRWSIAFEIGNRFTNTDYIDDVSDTYFNFAQAQSEGLISSYDPVQAELADRRHTPEGVDLTPVPTGTPYRGSPEYNDSYLFTIVHLTYTYKKYRAGLFSRKKRYRVDPRKTYQRNRSERHRELEKHRQELEKEREK